MFFAQGRHRPNSSTVERASLILWLFLAEEPSPMQLNLMFPVSHRLCMSYCPSFEKYPCFCVCFFLGLELKWLIKVHISVLSWKRPPKISLVSSLMRERSSTSASWLSDIFSVCCHLWNVAGTYNVHMLLLLYNTTFMTFVRYSCRWLLHG